MMHKAVSIILIFLMITVSASASNGCTRENSLQTKEISDKLYNIISDKRSMLSAPTQKYIFTKEIFNRLFQIKSQSHSDVIQCSISSVGYRLSGDMIGFSKEIDTSHTGFELLPSDIQKNILDSKNSMY